MMMFIYVLIIMIIDEQTAGEQIRRTNAVNNGR